MSPITRGTLALAAVVMMMTGCQTPRFASTPLERDEAAIEESDVPPMALRALRKAANGRPLTEFEREDRGQYVAYEAEWQEGGVEAEATVLADGSLVETERELTPAEFATLPPGVLQRVRTLQERGYDVEVARRTLYLYEIDAARQSADDAEDGDELEHLLRPDGTEATR